MRRYTKEDVQFHSDRFQDSQPAVNVKVYGSIWNVKLPLHLSTYSEDKGATWKESYTDAGFTTEWIEAHSEGEEWIFQSACEDGLEQAESEAEEIFTGYSVKLWQQGRSGGWLVVDGLPAFEEWDAVMLAKWRKFENRCEAIKADIPRVAMESLYFNVYLPAREDATAWTIGNLKPSGSGIIENERKVS